MAAPSTPLLEFRLVSSLESQRGLERGRDRFLSKVGVATPFRLAGTVELVAMSKPVGRPSKGSRKSKFVRLPEDLAAAAETYAQQCGKTFNDLAGELLAQHLRENGVEVHYSTQEAMQLTT